MATTVTTQPTGEAVELQPIRPETSSQSQDHQNTAQVWGTPGYIMEDPRSEPKLSKTRMVTTIIQLASINLISSFTNGVMTVGLPTMARDINLPRELYLWPLSVFGLTCGSMLLMAGSIADVIGARRVELIGCFTLAAFMLACGFAETGVQLTLFRAFQGVAMAMHLPAAVSIATKTVPKGKGRNMAFASLGFARDIGYSVGLVLSGVLIEASGWRLNFYLAGGGMFLIAFTSIWSLPKETEQSVAPGGILKELYHKIDWIGSIVISSGLALLAYVLAIISADLDTIESPSSIGILVTSVALLVLFPFWMNYRERNGKPALIPNSLWQNKAFASTCVIIALSNGSIIALELFSSLYFQEIQNTGTLATSLQLLPNVAMGIAIGLSCGFFVHKVSAGWLVTSTSILCACAPLFMAVMDPEWTYWYMAFWAQALSPISVSVLVTVGMLIVSDVFPDKSQALAGAVFNTVANFGLSFGVGLCQLVALGVTDNQAQGSHGEEGEGSDGHAELPEGDVLLRGYRASFWTMHGFMLLCAVVAFFGLRRVGKVGLKRE